MPDLMSKLTLMVSVECAEYVTCWIERRFDNKLIYPRNDGLRELIDLSSHFPSVSEMLRTCASYYDN